MCVCVYIYIRACNKIVCDRVEKLGPNTLECSLHRRRETLKRNLLGDYTDDLRLARRLYTTNLYDQRYTSPIREVSAGELYSTSYVLRVHTG